MSHPSNKMTPENVGLLFGSVKPTDKQADDMVSIRENAIYLAQLIMQCAPDCADRSAALRAVREAAMWANAAITKDGHGG